ncbi:hypothetical protein [Enterococcus sp. 5H]|uniref:hypothetical protein n=1 Tax=Enterococcus sp. 5H TaxID=1229490 RepID=UPI002304759B|nr:hypothetical protein [Enterococcus sp. 5H]MDA9472331.1 hypothetical protein [Enterococcus sp. 5H]
MKNKRIILIIALSMVAIVGIGGTWYMKREKDLAELHDIQTDLANYLYNNYRLYTRDEEKVAIIYQEFDKGKGTITEQEYFDKLDNIKEYSDIEKIEFTGFFVGPMKTLKVNYTINNVIEKETSLDTISAETNKLLYSVGTHDGDGPVYLEKKDSPTNLDIPKNLVIYYDGGID